MDLGLVGFDGLVGSETGFVVGSDPETKHNKWCGSGFLKQERSEDELLWKGSKMAKIDDTSSKAMVLQEQQRNNNNINNSLLLRSNINNNSNNNSNHHSGDETSLFVDGQHQQQVMLSFSSTPKSESLLLDKASPNATLPYSFHPLSSYNRNAGYSSENINGAIRGAFTPSQWMELEHQALIYKYITANVPVPSHLLIPIRKALDSAAFCSFSTGLLRPNALGWGAFHLGFASNTDPEPGRCRRTDGKKWRCSRDAVVDQKYCERHMNRGRHRSRKPVEGQNGHGLTNPNTNTNNTSSKLLLPNSTGSSSNNNGNNINGSSSPSSSFSVVGLGNSASNNIISFGQSQEPKNMHQQQQQSLASDASAANSINRMFINNNNKINNGIERRIMQDGPALPMLPPTLDLKPKENPFMIHHHKHQIPYEESSRINNEFGLVTSDSLLNPSHKNPSNKVESQHSLRHFIDDCPKMHSDRTQLSISIPMASPEFMPFTSSPTNEKLTLSPLRLSRELDPIQMGLGVGSGSGGGGVNEESNNTTRQANWIPITWESSMCGPLGEVLNLSSSNNNNNNNANNDQCANNNKNSSSGLNLMSDGWDNSPSIGSSPTGVLQKTSFGSLSNSSAGSSPRAENNKTNNQEGASLCNDLLGSSTLGNAPSSLPAL